MLIQWQWQVMLAGICYDHVAPGTSADFTGPLCFSFQSKRGMVSRPIYLDQCKDRCDVWERSPGPDGVVVAEGPASVMADADREGWSGDPRSGGIVAQGPAPVMAEAHGEGPPAQSQPSTEPIGANEGESGIQDQVVAPTIGQRIYYCLTSPPGNLQLHLKCEDLMYVPA